MSDSASLRQDMRDSVASLLTCDSDPEDFKHIFDVNTFGPFYVARTLVRSWLNLPLSASIEHARVQAPAQKLGKQILFVSSISGLVAMSPQKQSAYNASKGALTMLSKVSQTIL